jgi:hypothetical protein
MKLVVLGSNGFLPNDLGQTACYAIPELSISLDAGTGCIGWTSTSSMTISMSI